MISVKILITTLLVLPLMAWAGGSSFDVRNYGAIGDGTKLDTAALQQAIDTAANAGGGTVNFPSGRYLSGSLELKSHVTLELEAGAILLGSPRLSDYHHGDYRGLLWADRQQDFTVSGPGVIDGQGGELVAGTEAGDRPSHAKAGPRPMVINFHNCTHITVQDITLQDSASWVEDYRDCDHLTLKHITVRSMAALNNDGMDIDGCQQVVVRGCDIDSEDDGICLKSKDRTCADVLVENCRVRSSCNALKCGTESAGGFKNITCRNLEIYDTYISAIALETVDGGEMANVRISQVKITGTHNAIFIRLGHRNVNGAVGAIHGVTLEDITAEIPKLSPAGMNKFPVPDPYHTPALITASITGLPGHPVQDVTLKNISILYGGIGPVPESAHKDWENPAGVPERPQHYPESKMFGTLPAWGFYCRHAEGLTFDNVTLSLQSADYRAAVVCDDVRNLGVDGLHVGTAGSAPVIVLDDVHGATIRNSAPPAGTTSFIKTMGRTENVQGP